MSNQTAFSTTTIILAIVSLIMGGGSGYFISNNYLQPRINDLETDVEILNSEITNLVSTTTSLEQEVVAKEAEIESLEDDISDYQSAYAEIFDLESDVTILESQISNLETLNDDLESQVTNIETLYNNLTSQMNDLETINNNIRSALALYAWNPTQYSSARELPGDPVYWSIISQKLGTEAIVSRPSEIETTYLQLNRYFELYFIGINQAGGDLLGYVVAMHINGYGFIPDFMSQEHVSYLFESINSTDEALELIQLAYHRSQHSAYGREYTEITSNEMYESVVAEMNASYVSSGDEFKVQGNPPVNYTQVSVLEDGFCVERIFQKKSGRQCLIYMKAYVYNDGSM